MIYKFQAKKRAFMILIEFFGGKIQTKNVAFWILAPFLQNKSSIKWYAHYWDSEILNFLALFHLLVKPLNFYAKNDQFATT